MSTNANGPPNLNIPIALDTRAVFKRIDELEAKLKELGNKGAADVEKIAEAGRDFGDVLADLATHNAYAMIKDAGATLAGAFGEAVDHIKEIASEYTTLREQLQQVAALTGNANSGTFTADQARAAAAAGLKPGEYVKFQETFQSYAGAYLEGDQRKLSDDDAKAYQARLAQFAKARGISADEAAQLGGGVLQFAEGEISADEAMNRFGRAFKTLERAPTPVKQLLPQMTRVMAQGADSDEAAQLLALASEIAPGEEETLVTNTLKGVNRSLVEDKGGELGVTSDMTPLQKVRAAVETLRDRVAGGEDLDKLIAAYFPDIRETRGARGFLSRGLGAGGFDRVRGYVDSTPADFTQTAIADYAASDQGRYAQALADREVARIEQGERYAEFERRRIVAEAELEREGRFTASPGLGDLARSIANKTTFGYIPDRQEQLTLERVHQDVYAEAKAAGIDRFSPEGKRLETERNGYLANLPNTVEFVEVFQQAVKHLKSIDERGAKAAAPPLNATPPRPRTR